MTRARRPKSVIRCIAILAMLLSFMVASSMPQGYMPGRSESGLITVVLCSADGPREMLLDLGGPPPAPMPEKTCDWALAHAATVLAEPLALPSSLVALTEVARDFGLVADHPAPLQYLPQARAPPVPA